MEPYVSEGWWKTLLWKPFAEEGNWAPMLRACSKLFWRNSKLDVAEEVDLTGQKLLMFILTCSYNCHLTPSVFIG